MRQVFNNCNISLYLVPQELLFDISKMNLLRHVEIINTPPPTIDYTLSNANVQKLINSENLHFDLVINEEFFHDAFLMFGFKFNAPIVTISKLYTLK